MTTTDDIPRPWLASYRAEVPHTYNGTIGYPMPGTDVSWAGRAECGYSGRR